MKHHRMQLTTILNRVGHFKSFAYGKSKSAKRGSSSVEDGAHKNIISVKS